MKHLLLLSTLALFTLASCSPRLTPLTKSLRQQNGWSENELSKIQFYLSEDLILSRQRNSGTTEIVQGRVRVENGKDIEEIIFKRGTPGVVLFSPKDDNLALGFDARDDSKFLVFGPNPKQSGRYTLLASDWKRYRGKVTYAGETWEVSAANSDINLLLDMKKRGRTETRVKQETGRRL
ncbi:MAG: hypothetical protein AB8F78_12770 [Saprospiraceae bacterium]